MGMTFAIFNLEMNLPVDRERLNMSARIEEISLISDCKTLFGMLFEIKVRTFNKLRILLTT